MRACVQALQGVCQEIPEFGKPYPILRITGGNSLMRSDIFYLIGYAKGNMKNGIERRTEIYCKKFPIEHGI